MEYLDDMSVAAVNKYSSMAHLETPTLFIESNGSLEISVSEDIRKIKTIASKNNAIDFSSATNTDAQRELWHARHNAYYATLALSKGARCLTTDVCVPISMLPQCMEETRGDLEKTGLLAPILGHVGDGNFHALLLVHFDNQDEVQKAKAASDRLVRRALASGGTCTGEHGIGFGKLKYLEDECDNSSRDLMMQLKLYLDPYNIMNPGKAILAPTNHVKCCR
mmetsp:Transcript_4883/g.14731  ORF Transcript_4883/g.14731 Transcript_4883/m.14731 type:complete len:222 (+) Transcript_4883:912-1577(+)